LFRDLLWSSSWVIVFKKQSFLFFRDYIIGILEFFNSVVVKYKYCKETVLRINLLSKPGFVEFSYHRVLACGRVTSAVNVINNSTVFLPLLPTFLFKTVKYNRNAGGLKTGISHLVSQSLQPAFFCVHLISEFFFFLSKAIFSTFLLLVQKRKLQTNNLH
jgi:hypothetical protein